MRPRSILISLATAGGLIVLAACGSGSENDASGNTASSDAAAIAGQSTAQPTPPDDATFNAADAEFTHAMIGHHQQAVEMAAVALDARAAASPAVIDLATRIQGAQQPEIEMMNGWLTTWGQPHQQAESMEGMDMGGMMSDESMTALAAASGPEFDKMWLEMMIEHHRGAVTSALVVQQDGRDPEVKRLAAAVISAQNLEIDEMTALL